MNHRDPASTPEVGPSPAAGPATVSLVRVGAAAIVAASAEAVAELVRARPQILLADSPQDAQAQAAIRALLTAGLPADSLIVQTVRVGAALGVLAEAGAQTIEWPVSAPVPGAPGFEALLEALATAGELGLWVQLRWTVDNQMASRLADLETWIWDRHGAPNAPARRVVAVVVQPDLGPSAPDLHAVEAGWPAWPADAVPRLVRSQRWPACLLAPSAQIEPASLRQLNADRPTPVTACETCSLYGGQCPGMASDLATQLAPNPLPWPGLRAAHTPPVKEGRLVFDPECAEVRGLRMGVRSAWRLRLPRRDIQLFQQAAQHDGWQVAVSDGAVSMAVGGHMTPCPAEAPEAMRLLVVAREEGAADACLADEWALVTAPACQSEEQAAEMLERHRRLGAAYGFPPCCVEAFCDAFVETLVQTGESDGTPLGDNALQIQRAQLRSQHFDPRLATLAGKLGEPNHTPLRHLPCRFDCAASIALAEQLGAPVGSAVARPALVLEDGSFVWLQGQVQEDRQSVHQVTSVQAVGADTTASNALWDQEFHEPRTWDALRRSPSGLELGKDGEWRLVTTGMAAPFPLLLPFSWL